MSSGVGRRRNSDLALLWLWLSPAAVALTRPLAWEPPYAVSVALKKKKKKKKKTLRNTFAVVHKQQSEVLSQKPEQTKTDTGVMQL